MPNQSSNTSEGSSNRRHASNRKHHSARIVTIPGNECGFISGPPHRAIQQTQLDISEILSERFEPRKCLDNLRGRLVCVAYDRVENREVVLKVQRKPNASEPTILEREAMVGDYLPQHDNVVQLHSLHFWPASDGRQLIALAMGYADGGSLRHWLHHQTNWDLPIQAKALELFRSLCLGVGALHEHGILHLDLKPENALIQDGVVKVADFGAADVSRCTQRTGGVERIPPLPSSGGTPYYMAPEQFTARATVELTEGADIYALGAIFFEIRNPAHRPPFTGSYRQLCRLHQTASVPVLPNLSQAETKLINWCMAKNPRERCESVDELIEVFDQVYPPGAMLRSDGNQGDGQSGFDEAVTRNNTATELYEEVKRKMDDGDLDELLSLAAKAAELCPNHPQTEAVNVRLAHRVKVFTENAEACKVEVAAGRLESALLCAQHTVAANPKSVIGTQLLARVSHLKQLKAEMVDAAAARDFERAMRAAKELDAAGVPADEAGAAAGGA